MTNRTFPSVPLSTLILVLLSIAFLFQACSKDEDNPEPEMPGGPPGITVELISDGEIQDATDSETTIVVDRDSRVTVRYEIKTPNGFSSARLGNDPAGDAADQVNIFSGNTSGSITITWLLFGGAGSTPALTVTDAEGETASMIINFEFEVDIDPDNILPASWTPTTFSAPDDAGFSDMISTIDGSLMVLYSTGVARSEDNGASWTYTPLTGVEDAFVIAEHPSGDLYVSSFFGNTLAKSTDKGATWEVLNIDLPALEGIFAINFSDDGTFYIGGFDPMTGTNTGLYTSEDGENWTFSENLGNVWIQDIETQGNDFVALAGAEPPKVYITSDAGDSWTSSADLGEFAVNSLLLTENNFFAGSVSGAYRSTDQGASWEKITQGLPEQNLTIPDIIESEDGSIYIAVDSYGVFTLRGDSWKSLGTDLATTEIQRLASVNGVVFAVSNRGVLYKLEE